jgi:membrane protein implicated in regulation of membrane protease activity
VGRFKFFTGWLLLGFLLFIAAMGLEGAFLAPNLRRLRAATAENASPQTADAAATTIQVVAWFLLAVVVFLMVDRPF